MAGKVVDGFVVMSHRVSSEGNEAASGAASGASRDEYLGSTNSASSAAASNGGGQVRPPSAFCEAGAAAARNAFQWQRNGGSERMHCLLLAVAALVLSIAAQFVVFQI